MKFIVFFLAFVVPTVVSAMGVQITDNQVVFQDKNKSIHITNDGFGPTEGIQSCSSDQGISHYSIVKRFKKFSVIRNMITCIGENYKPVRLNEFDSGPYLALPSAELSEKYNDMPIVIPHGSDMYEKYYIITHTHGKLIEQRTGNMTDVTAQIFDAADLNVVKDVNPFYDVNIDTNSIILENLKNSYIDLNVFGSKYVRFRWNIAYFDTDKKKNKFLITKKQDVIDAGFAIEKYGNFWRAYKTSKTTWQEVYEVAKRI